MKNWTRWVTAALVMTALTASVMARSEPNSFLEKAAPTHEALMSQVKNDRRVMDRFMRHFGMTKQDVVNMVGGLKMARLPEDGIYLVYNCSDKEEIRSRVMFYKRGTLVWVDGTGKAVLKVSCGNPMVRGTDNGGSQPLTTTTSVMPVTEVRAQQIEVGATIPSAMDASIVAPGVPEASPLNFSAVSTPMTPVLGSHRTNLSWIAAPLVGGLFLSKDHRSKQPVPEPATMIALGGAATMFIARRKKASK